MFSCLCAENTSLVAITLTSTQWCYSARFERKTDQVKETGTDWSLIFSSIDPWPQVIQQRAGEHSMNLPSAARILTICFIGHLAIIMLHWAKQTEQLLHTKLSVRGQRVLHEFGVLHLESPAHMNNDMAHQLISGENLAREADIKQIN